MRMAGDKIAAHGGAGPERFLKKKRVGKSLDAARKVRASRYLSAFGPTEATRSSRIDCPTFSTS
jgi:hypothetical protein